MQDTMPHQKSQPDLLSVQNRGEVIVCDYNPEMIAQGREKQGKSPLSCQQSYLPDQHTLHLAVRPQGHEVSAIFTLLNARSVDACRI